MSDITLTNQTLELELLAEAPRKGKKKKGGGGGAKLSGGGGRKKAKRGAKRKTAKRTAARKPAKRKPAKRKRRQLTVSVLSPFRQRFILSEAGFGAYTIALAWY